MKRKRYVALCEYYLNMPTYTLRQMANTIHETQYTQREREINVCVCVLIDFYQEMEQRQEKLMSDFYK